MFRVTILARVRMLVDAWLKIDPANLFKKLRARRTPFDIQGVQKTFWKIPSTVQVPPTAKTSRLENDPLAALNVAYKSDRVVVRARVDRRVDQSWATFKRRSNGTQLVFLLRSGIQRQHCLRRNSLLNLLCESIRFVWEQSRRSNWMVNKVSYTD